MDPYLTLWCRQVGVVGCLGRVGMGVFGGVAFVFEVVRPATPHGRGRHLHHDFHTTVMEAWCS